MKYYLILKKLLVALLTALLVSLACYAVLFFSPGDPAALLLRHKNPTGGLDQKTVELYADRLGTGRGFREQYLDWLGNAVKGDFGISYKSGAPVIEEFTSRFGCTFLLMLFSIGIALLVGILLGLLSARYHNGVLDHITRTFTVFNMSTPSFWLALIFLWLFAVKLRLFPAFGYDGLRSLVLPSVVQGLSNCGTFLRVTRICALDSLASGYVITARAKGLDEFSLLIKHVFKNILIPILTMMGGTFASLIGGSVIIETVFGLPGIGNYLISAIGVKDFPVILGFLFVLGLMIITMNLLIDAIYIVIDPRVRQGTNET